MTHISNWSSLFLTTMNNVMSTPTNGGTSPEVIPPNEMLELFGTLNIAGQQPKDKITNCTDQSSHSSNGSILQMQVFNPNYNSSNNYWAVTTVPFRHLVSLYDAHITHTPMMMAAEFSRSAIARHSDFTTSAEERGIFTLSEKGNVRMHSNFNSETNGSSNTCTLRPDVGEPFAAA